jgi:Fur family ferric uptake transcriptional regulator
MRGPRAPQWQSHFRTHHLRITKPRKMIMEFLSGTKTPVSAEEIYMNVHKAYPTLGFATVYRTLDLLAGMGIVSKLQFGDERNRYELAESHTQRGHHHHLVCTRCRTVIDYDDFVDEERELIKKVEKELTRKHRFHIVGHAMHFYGECARCWKRH